MREVDDTLASLDEEEVRVIFVLVGGRRAGNRLLEGNRDCSTIDELTLRVGKCTGKWEDPEAADGIDIYRSTS